MTTTRLIVPASAAKRSARSVPSTAACFLGYETAASAFRDRMDDAAAADAREPLGPAVGYSS